MLSDGADYGFAIDPVADVLRIVNTADQNLRVSANDGSLILLDSSLDRAGNEEGINGVAYDHSVAGATATTLFGLDYFGVNPCAHRRRRRRAGLAECRGDHGHRASRSLRESALGGFDIEARTGEAFAALFTGGAPNPGETALYKINLDTGAATSLGAIGDGATKVRGITAALPNDLAIAPGGKSATYLDLDGDKVTVKLKSFGVLSAEKFRFATGEFGSQLLTFKLSPFAAENAALRERGPFLHRRALRGEGRRLREHRAH